MPTPGIVGGMKGIKEVDNMQDTHWCRSYSRVRTVVQREGCVCDTEVRVLGGVGFGKTATACIHT